MCRFSYQFLVAALTFAIGVVFTAVIAFSIQLPKVEVIDNSVSEPVSVLENPDEIEIKYENSLSGVDELHATFSVKNNSDKSVYYFGSLENNNQDSHINQDGKKIYLGMYEGTEITEQELKPNKSTSFIMPAPQNEKPFEAEFGLRVGETRKPQIILVEVSQQVKTEY